MHKDGIVLKDYHTAIRTGQKKEKREYNPDDVHRAKKDSDNLKRSISRSRQEVYNLIRNTSWDLFVTLTVSPEVANRYDDNEVMKKSKSLVFDQVRRKDPNFKYVCIPERHKDGALHFHMLCTKPAYMVLFDTLEVDKGGRGIFTSKDFEKLGRTSITLVDNQETATKYVTKYITKESAEIGRFKHRYYASKNLDKPKVMKLLLEDEQKKIVVHQAVTTCTVVSAKTIEVPKANNTINLFELT